MRWRHGLTSRPSNMVAVWIRAKVSKARSACLLLAQSRHAQCADECPLSDAEEMRPSLVMGQSVGQISKSPAIPRYTTHWNGEWDSNPRYGYPYNGFRV
jgi:hypothetical protein